MALLATLAGCSAFNGGISDEELDREGDYDDLRESNATARIDVDSGEFHYLIASYCWFIGFQSVFCAEPERVTAGE
ncbi:hypothetical protein EL22_26375 [Halostagnicola sp. A56]|uniref:hypothetical protein n=1 Tax=Halostagnicola sp. A56 TaxID=1495067 RepID=UPI00065F6AFE|nr:hypothetical protein [Halostagnicola sp. A56]KMT45858.1 hypothetical protein EL22_26375 [Halostagnicola sp. A56]